MDKGVYCLIFKNQGLTVRVGALGDLTFQAGWHIYVGSALGSGGLKRLERHISLAHGSDKKPKWHIDYLLTNPDFSLFYAIFVITQEQFECRLARLLNNSGVPGFCRDARTIRVQTCPVAQQVRCSGFWLQRLLLLIPSFFPEAGSKRRDPE